MRERTEFAHKLGKHKRRADGGGAAEEGERGELGCNWDAKWKIVFRLKKKLSIMLRSGDCKDWISWDLIIKKLHCHYGKYEVLPSVYKSGYCDYKGCWADSPNRLYITCAQSFFGTFCGIAIRSCIDMHILPTKLSSSFFPPFFFSSRD